MRLNAIFTLRSASKHDDTTHLTSESLQSLPALFCSATPAPPLTSHSTALLIFSSVLVYGQTVLSA